MTDMPADRERLATRMDQRRADLNLRWNDVADAGGLSLKTLFSVRTDPDHPVTRSTAAKIEKGLQWQPGSVAAILRDDEPVPAGNPGTDPAEAGVTVLPSSGTEDEAGIRYRDLILSADPADVPLLLALGRIVDPDGVPYTWAHKLELAEGTLARIHGTQKNSSASQGRSGTA